MDRIRISNIQSAYGKKQVLREINISAAPGQCIGLVGANGCGKSTLLNILAGLRKADGGEIFFDGQPVHKKQQFIRYVGYVPQDSNLIEEVTVWDNLLLAYGDRELLKKELQDGFLKYLGLQEMCDLKAGKLSGGMKKRAAIGCAMASNPSILLLDEPGAALDLPGKGEVRKYLEFYKKQGGTILIATHEESDLDLCDKIYALSDGVSREIDKSIRGDMLVDVIRGKINGTVKPEPVQENVAVEAAWTKKEVAEAVAEEQKPARRKRRIIGIAAAVAVGVLAITAICMMFLSIKSPKERFIQGMDKLMAELEHYGPSLTEELKPKDFLDSFCENPVTVDARLNVTLPDMLTVGLDILHDSVYAEKNANTNVAVSVYNISLFDADITVSENMWYVAVPEFMEEVYSVDGDTLGRDYNNAAWTYRLGLPVSEDFIWESFAFFYTMQDEKEAFRELWSEGIAGIKEGMEVEKVSAPKDAKAGNVYLRVVLQEEDMNELAENIMDYCAESGMVAMTDNADAVFGDDVEMLVTLDRKGRIIQITSEEIVTFEESFPGEWQFTMDFLGKRNVTDSVEGVVTVQFEEFDAEIMLEREKQQEDADYEDNVLVEIEISGGEESTDVQFSLDSEWNQEEKKFRKEAELSINGDSYAAEIKGSLSDVTAGERFFLDLSRLTLYENDTEVFKVTGEVQVMPFEGRNSVPSASISPFDLSEEEAEKLLTNLIDKIYEKILGE